jgi:hypothetical protein
MPGNTHPWESEDKVEDHRFSGELSPHFHLNGSIENLRILPMPPGKENLFFVGTNAPVEVVDLCDCVIMPEAEYSRLVSLAGETEKGGIVGG